MKKNKYLYGKFFLAVMSFFLVCVAFGTTNYINSNQLNSKSQKISIEKTDKTVLVLQGKPANMGYQYGYALRKELQEILRILKEHFISLHGLRYDQLFNRASLLYKRFPDSYQSFIQNAAKGSSLSFQDMVILNGMETLGTLLAPSSDRACALLFIPPQKTRTGHSLIARNYDYPPPFDRLAKYLTVTILKEQGKIPVAFISIPGEIYCPTCINSAGLFMELNNGGPSGGFLENHNTGSMLASMLEILQDSHSLSEAELKLYNLKSDFSLIVNVADTQNISSFEYATSSLLKTQNYRPNDKEEFIVTNFFTNPVWGSQIPLPNDSTSWYGVKRKNGLSSLASKVDTFDVDILKKLMDIPIDKGGALWSMTIYQIIFDPTNMSLYIKTVDRPSIWRKVSLKRFFK